VRTFWLPSTAAQLSTAAWNFEAVRPLGNRRVALVAATRRTLTDRTVKVKQSYGPMSGLDAAADSAWRTPKVSQDRAYANLLVGRVNTAPVLIFEPLQE
jgi:hypothetical protein